MKIGFSSRKNKCMHSSLSLHGTNLDGEKHNSTKQIMICYAPGVSPCKSVSFPLSWFEYTSFHAYTNQNIHLSATNQNAYHIINKKNSYISSQPTMFLFRSQSPNGPLSHLHGTLPVLLGRRVLPAADAQPGAGGPGAAAHVLQLKGGGEHLQSAGLAVGSTQKIVL